MCKALVAPPHGGEGGRMCMYFWERIRGFEGGMLMETAFLISHMEGGGNVCVFEH